MKHSIKYYLYTLSVIVAAACFTACEDEITLDSPGDYGNIDGVYGSVKNVSGARELSVVSIFGNQWSIGQLYFELTKVTNEKIFIKYKVDKDVLEAYNKANGTSYEMYPEEEVTFSNEGIGFIDAGAQKSENIEIKIFSNGTAGKTYALPVSVEVTIGGVKVSKTNDSYIYLVKTFNAIPDSDKGTGFKSILYVEVNDENILNAGEYTMAGSNKPFFDVVNIFAANINYNSTTGRAYINCNENVAHILKNADQYIRPLQAKGMKVCLTLLGNHDEAGVSNLSPAAAADFAREIKTYIDVYGLDGIDFDDEYSAYKTENPSPGFEVPSPAAAARLVYECRKIMPDKIVSFYDFGDHVCGGTVEGIPVGDLLDYSYWGLYGSWRDRSEDITGLGKKKYCPAPINLNFSASNGGYRLQWTEDLYNGGYGIQMFYDLKTPSYDYGELFNDVSRVIFKDDVKWSGTTYAKNSTAGTKHSNSYNSYLGSWKTTSANSLYYYYDGPWWDWSGSMETTLKIEEKEAGKSYTIYGWYGTEDELPLTANYNSATGRIEIPLPQTATDKETGEEWLYMGRAQYTFADRFFMNFDEQYTGYSGLLRNGNIAMYAAPHPGYLFSRTMAAVQLNEEGNEVIAIKGYLDKDVVWQPFTLNK